MTSASMVAEKQRGSAKVWVVVFFVLLFFFLVGLSRVVYSPVSKTITGFTPGSSGGDDAHYLLTVNSLLFDGDLQLQEDYRRALEGGWGAGMRQRWVPLEHHTLLVDPVTKEHQYFSSVFRGDPYRFCAAEECRIYLKEWKLFSNPDAVVEFLAHPIGFPVMVAGLLYPTFPGPWAWVRSTRWWRRFFWYSPVLGWRTRGLIFPSHGRGCF
jgi:hypothetical protein